MTHSTTSLDAASVVPVDLQADVLAPGAEVVEQDGVLLRRQHVAGDGIGGWRAAHRRAERLAGGDLGGDAVRRVVGVGGDLHGELAVRAPAPPTTG